VLCVGTLRACEADERRKLIGEMWRALAPGGWLVILEELVPRDDSGAENAAEFGGLDLETAIVDGTGGGAILEHFEALRYPPEDLRHAGLAVCSKASGTSDAVRIHGLSLSASSSSHQELGYGSGG
jgi:hypothetical protein